jgi:PAS domain S-box-containing protein
MRDEKKTKAQLIEELEELRRRLSESKRSIAGRRQVAKELKEGEEMYRSLVETTSDWIWEVDRDGIYTYASPKVKGLLGYEPEEIIGNTPFDLMPPDEAERVAGTFAAIARDKRPFSGLENTNVAKDGRYVVLETSGVPILDDHGDLLGYRGIDRDITEYKQAEEALRESEKRFHALSEAGFEGICIHEGGKVLASNHAFAAMLGYEPPEIVGTDALRFVKQEYLEEAKTHIREGYEQPYEVEMVRRDGSTFTAEVRARNTTYLGRPVRVGAVRDVTERRQHEDRILRQSALLQGINRVLREALTSHTDREVAQVCVAVAVEILQSELCIFGELNEKGRFDTLAYSDMSWEACKMSVEEAWQRSTDMVLRGVWAQPILEGKSMIVDEPSAHPASVGTPQGHPRLGAYLGVPLRYGDKVIGLIAVANKEGGYDAADREDLEALSTAFVEALYRKRAELELEVHRHRLEELVEERASELKATQERLSAFMDAAPCSFSLWDPELKLIDINEYGLRLFPPGTRREDVIGKNILEIDPYIQESGRIDRYREVIETGEPFHSDDLVPSPPFGDRHLSAKSFKVGDGMGAIVEDVTERARERERIERLNHLFLGLGADIIDNVEAVLNAGLDILGGDGMQYCRLQDDKLSSIIVTPGSSTFTVTDHPESHICCLIIHGDSEGAVVVEDVWNIPNAEEYEEVREYGHRSFVGYPVRLGSRIIGCLSLYSRAERSFSMDELETLGTLAQIISIDEERLAREERLKDFIDIASHELRHPIAVMKGYAILLKEKEDQIDEEIRREALEAIDRGADHLNALVLELLDTTRIERGEFTLARSEVSLRALVEQSLLEVDAKEKGDVVKVNVDENIGVLNVDPGKITRLLSALLENAVKFAPPGSEIEVDVRLSGDEVVVSVLDRGEGIPEEEWERIFERFYQVGEARYHSIPGIGLGLYIARQIAEAHGGRIWCESHEGGGSIFRFFLPL